MDFLLAFASSLITLKDVGVHPDSVKKGREVLKSPISIMGISGYNARSEDKNPFVSSLHCVRNSSSAMGALEPVR